MRSPITFRQKQVWHFDGRASFVTASHREFADKTSWVDVHDSCSTSVVHTKRNFAILVRQRNLMGINIRKQYWKVKHFHVSSKISFFACRTTHLAEYKFDLQPTANKSYWRNFCIFPTFLVSKLCTTPTVWEKLFFFLNKCFEIQHVCFFRSDEFENDCWFVCKRACSKHLKKFLINLACYGNISNLLSFFKKILNKRLLSRKTAWASTQINRYQSF